MATVPSKPLFEVTSLAGSISSRAFFIRELGMEQLETSAILEVLDSGLTWAQVADFQRASGFSAQEIASFLELPERTFARRRSTGRFGKAESERLLRLMEIYGTAFDLFGGDLRATHEWLTSPVRGLNNARPTDYAQSDFGAREVRNLLGRLAHGVFS